MYKPAYSKDEMKALFEWFKLHEEQLPAEMQIDDSTYSRNLTQTVKQLIRSLENREITTVLSGEACILFKIKAALEKENNQ